MLKYPVIVRSITNLSDARYCAGMGVELMSYDFDPESSFFIDENKFVGITSWLSGVNVIFELPRYINLEVNRLETEYKPAFFLFKDFSNSKIELQNAVCLYELELDKPIKFFPPLGSIVLLSSSKVQDKLNNYQSLLKELVFNYQYQLFPGFGFDKGNLDEVFKTYSIKGFCLRGGSELSPGLKDFDELAEILEALEV
jgi:phosphoribosylanthranilate isomerase